MRKFPRYYHVAVTTVCLNQISRDEFFRFAGRTAVYCFVGWDRSLRAYEYVNWKTGETYYKKKGDTLIEVGFDF
jgi:hypothetical protein